VAGFDRFARHGDVEKAVGGRLLLTELNCTACHATPRKELAAKSGPNLSGAGDRINRDWIRRYLAAPQSVKPGTTMPDVLATLPEVERKRAIDALAAFLSTQHAPFPEPQASGANPVPHEFWSKGVAERGRRLYHQVACVACHEPDAVYEGGTSGKSPLDRLLEELDPDEIAAMGLTAAARPVRSVPHGELPAKYDHRSLTFFLLDPAATRPGGRMPALKLSPVEAADVAAYLLREKPAGDAGAGDPAGGAVDAGLVAAGRRLFVELKCANCHAASGIKPAGSANPLATLNAGGESSCIGRPSPGLPHFPLDEQQTDFIETALLELAEATNSAFAPQPLADGALLDFQLLQLNCYACHERDRRGGVGRRRQRYFETVGHIDLGDEGRLPPPLSSVGRKLDPAWLQKVLAGAGDVRPHLLARMPVYPVKAVAALPAGFAAADGWTKPAEQDVFSDLAGLAAPGRELLDTGCVQCHPLRGESVADVVGIDLAGVTSRAHPHWFHDFLLEPIRLKPNTRMPTFFPGGKSSNPDVLKGNTERQIAAMWAYLKDLDRQRLPEKIELARSQSFELIPTERPILQRTFMPQAGTHAIAVGFPAQTHFAFDAEGVRPAEAWRGRFLDAHGTWFVRSAPPAEPLGEDHREFPAGAPLALLADEREPWPAAVGEEAGYRFLGYRIDRAGVPTFLYRFDRFDVEDRIEPNGKAGLKRKLTVTRRDGGEGSLWFRVQTGKTLEQDGASYAGDRGITASVAPSAGRRAKLREFADGADCIVPVVFNGDAAVIEVEYRW
jgi:mono/diheme cytochrome c family protein